MIEVTLYRTTPTDPLPWRPYRPPVRFERLHRNVVCFALYRCGSIETCGAFMRTDQDGTLVLDTPELVDKFLIAVAAYPVFLPAGPAQRVALNDKANARRIACYYFDNGIGFRNAQDAVLVRTALLD